VFRRFEGGAAALSARGAVASALIAAGPLVVATFAFLTLDVIGTFYDTDRSDFSLGWGAFANPTGKSGWNSVTITVTCRRQ
jgi:hypothetical protein